MTAVVSLGLTGCVTTRPVDKELDALRQQALTAEIAPIPSDWQEQMKRSILPLLKDPDSAKFDFENVKAPERAVTRRADGTHYFHWFVYCRVNAKNSYGGYAGYTLFRAKAADGAVFEAAKDPSVILQEMQMYPRRRW